MLDLFEMWVDFWSSNCNVLLDSIFLLYDMVLLNFMFILLFILLMLKVLGESSDLFIGEDFDDIIDCAMDLFSFRIVVNARKRMCVEFFGDEVFLVFGSCVM